MDVPLAFLSYPYDKQIFHINSTHPKASFYHYLVVFFLDIQPRFPYIQPTQKRVLIILMNHILEWGINFIAGLQTSAPWLAAPSRLFSFLGTEEFYLFILPFLCWCVDIRLGLRVGVILTVSDSLNIFFKLAFHQPRPFWVSDRVRVFSAEASYGLPSGHAQHAMTVWGTIAAWVKGCPRWLMAALIFLIGYSRIVLAVHFPTDVLAGWLIGGLILWAFLKWEAAVTAWFNRFTLAQKIALAFAASMLLLIISLSGLAFLPPADPPQWEITAARAFSLAPGQSAIHPRGTTGTVGVAGTFFGLVAGAILIFQRGGFDARGAWWKRAVRFALGVIGVAILWLGLRMVFPRDASLVSQVLRYLRYGLIGFWVAYGGPWVFIKLGLQNTANVLDQAAPR
jgi:membrane-associated phospholipid phosphatase